MYSISRHAGSSTSMDVGLWRSGCPAGGCIICGLPGESANEQVCRLASELVDGRTVKRTGELVVLYLSWWEGGRSADW